MIKTQTIRLIDVFVIAPIIFVGSRAVKDENLSLALLVISVATFAFNGVNYLENTNGNT